MTQELGVDNQTQPSIHYMSIDLLGTLEPESTLITLKSNVAQAIRMSLTVSKRDIQVQDEYSRTDRHLWLINLTDYFFR